VCRGELPSPGRGSCASGWVREERQRARRALLLRAWRRGIDGEGSWKGRDEEQRKTGRGPVETGREGSGGR
jgi:hypothetical protein